MEAWMKYIYLFIYFIVLIRVLHNDWFVGTKPNLVSIPQTEVYAFIPKVLGAHRLSMKIFIGTHIGADFFRNVIVQMVQNLDNPWGSSTDFGADLVDVVVECVVDLIGVFMDMDDRDVDTL
jgi:hypothetical protein